MYDAFHKSYLHSCRGFQERGYISTVSSYLLLLTPIFVHIPLWLYPNFKGMITIMSKCIYRFVFPKRPVIILESSPYSNYIIYKCNKYFLPFTINICAIW